MDIVEIVQSKYPYMSVTDVEKIINKAKMFYFGLKYPCEPNADETTRPITSFLAKQWIISACDELIQRLGFNSAVSYRENGITWSFDGAHLSDRLCSIIKPVVGVIKEGL